MSEPTRPLGNPIIPVYAADPDAQIIGHRFFIYATNAGYYPDRVTFEKGRGAGVAHGFSVWSSADLREWRSEGPILDFAEIGWARDLPNAWAPCLAERNGRYYFYFCADSRIGVAVSDSPTGPFVDAKGVPLIDYRDDMSAIDPMVFVDDDGQAYLYWGAVPGFWLEGRIEYVRMHLSVQKLAPDMVTLVGDEMPTIFTRRLHEEWHDLDHIEASHVIKRNGVYYLQWSEGSFNSPDLGRSYRVNYATAVSPLGPWHLSSQNPTLASRPEIKVIGPGHHSVIEVPGDDEYWCVYHCHPGDADRRVHVDRMTFLADGTIAPMLPTREGPEPRTIPFAIAPKKIGPFQQDEPISFLISLQTQAASVEFFAGSSKIGECPGDSRIWEWNHPPIGFQKISARAKTFDGRVLTSVALNLDVN